VFTLRVNFYLRNRNVWYVCVYVCERAVNELVSMTSLSKWQGRRVEGSKVGRRIRKSWKGLEVTRLFWRLGKPSWFCVVRDYSPESQDLGIELYLQHHCFSIPLLFLFLSSLSLSLSHSRRDKQRLRCRSQRTDCYRRPCVSLFSIHKTRHIRLLCYCVIVLDWMTFTHGK